MPVEGGAERRYANRVGRCEGVEACEFMSRSNGLMAERAAERLLPSECLVEEVARSAVAATRTVQAPKHLHHSRLYSWTIGERAKHLGLAPFQERAYSEGVPAGHHLRVCRLEKSREELNHLLGLGGGLLRTVALRRHPGRVESPAKDQECSYCGRHGQAGRVAARKEAEWSRRISFTATSRSSTPSTRWARHTLPIPPRPRRAINRYGPTCEPRSGSGVPSSWCSKRGSMPSGCACAASMASTSRRTSVSSQ